MKSTIIKITVTVLLCVCGAGIVQAQQITGTISGSVSDPTGAYIPGVNLTLTNLATGVKQNTVTQRSGTFYFNNINPGTYGLTAEASGFRTALVNNVQVEVGRTTIANIHLLVGKATQSVTVTGATPLIDTTDAQLSTTVSNAYIQQLGSSSRDALSYADMSPGVTVTLQAPAGAAASLCITCGAYATVNGSFNGHSSYYLDGIENFGAYRNYALQFPSPDAVQEVAVMTSNTSAEYGSQMGGTINVITKSGTNQFHGDAFYFFSPVALSANDAGNKFYDVPIVPNNLKEVGGTLGGPIIRNKTFFFLSYQRYSNSTAQLESSVRPGTPAMMLGDFSALLHPTAASGLSPVQLYDPNFPGQTHPIPNDDLQTYISPITGASLINPVGLALAKLMPTVSNYGDQFIWSFTDPQVNNELLAKIDQSIGSKQHLAVSFFGTNGSETLPGMGDNWNNVPNWGPEVDTANQIDLAVHYAWTVSPTLLIEPHFSMAFANADRGNSQIGRDLSSFGAMNVPTRQAGARKYLPSLYFNGMTAGEGWLSVFDQHSYEFGATVTYLHNQHQMKFGFSMQHPRLYQDNDQDNGGISFSGAFSTGLYGVSAPNDTGSALADMLMGYADGTSNNGRSPGSSIGFQQTGILLENDSTWSDSFFAQDQWKITPRVTLSPGLRYELYLPPTEANNKFSTFVPGYKSTLYPNAYLGMAFPGDPGIPRGLYKTDYTDIAPRFGAAWDVKGDGRTVLRGGVGWFYSINPLQNALNNSESNPWYPSAACQTTIISNPWLDCKLPSYAAPPTPFSVAPAALRKLNWQQSFGSFGAVGYAPGFKNPYSIQWNITAEHQFSHNIVVSTGYVGDRGFRLTVNVPINYAVYNSTASLDPANILSRQPYSNGAYAGNGGAGLYNNQLVQETARGEYYYNGWQTTVILRPVPSLQVHASYEYARGQTNDLTGDTTGGGVNMVVNPTAPFSMWGNYTNRDTFKAFYLWEIPFHPKNRWLNSIAGGWHFTGDVHAYSGYPSQISLGYDWAYDGLGQTNPSLSGPVTYEWKRGPQNFIQYLNVGNTSGQPGQDSNGYPIAQRGPWTLPGGGTNHSVYGNAPNSPVFFRGPGVQIRRC